MLGLIKSLAEGQQVWPPLFRNTLKRTLSVHRRFSGPRVSDEVVWMTTDARHGIVGVVDWMNREYLRLDSPEMMREFDESEGGRLESQTRSRRG